MCELHFYTLVSAKIQRSMFAEESGENNIFQFSNMSNYKKHGFVVEVDVLLYHDKAVQTQFCDKFLLNKSRTKRDSVGQSISYEKSFPFLF